MKGDRELENIELPHGLNKITPQVRLKNQLIYYTLRTEYAIVGLRTSQQIQNIRIAFIQRRPNVFDVGPTLYKCFVFAEFLGSL